jgi:hypothetical protein
MKLVSCAATPFGLCASTEADPGTNMNKYLPNDQYWVGGTCVSCPVGWFALNGRCYQYFAGPLSQSAAQSDCVTKNSSLAIANNQDKYNLIKALIPSGAAYV